LLFAVKNYSDEYQPTKKNGEITMTKTKIRSKLSDYYQQTSYSSYTNETFFPARWTWGESAGDASTSTPSDCRKSVAAGQVCRDLGFEFHDLDDDANTLPEYAGAIFDAQNN